MRKTAPPKTEQKDPDGREEASVYPHLPKDEKRILVNIMPRIYKYFEETPVLTMRHNLEKVATIAVKAKIKSDFFWSLEFSPVFCADLFFNGFLPIASRIEPFPPSQLKDQILRFAPALMKEVVKSPGLVVLMPKLHSKRCLLENWSDIHVGKNARKRAKKYSVSFNLDIEKVMEKCVEQHGENWLYPPVREMFRRLHKWPVKRKIMGKGLSVTSPKDSDGTVPIQLLSVELWDKDALVAGELGYSVGSVYTSLTGFYDVSSTGTIQMLAMAGILKKAGYDLWDLGMSLPYKKTFGAKDVDRGSFVEQLRKRRQKAPTVSAQTRELKVCTESGDTIPWGQGYFTIPSRVKVNARAAIDLLKKGNLKSSGTVSRKRETRKGKPRKNKKEEKEEEGGEKECGNEIKGATGESLDVNDEKMPPEKRVRVLETSEEKSGRLVNTSA